MTAALLTWIANTFGGLLLGAAGKIALDLYNSWQAAEAQRRAGAADAANKANAAAAETIDGMAQVGRPSDDDVARRMREHGF